MHKTDRTSTSEAAPEARSRERGRGPVALMIAVEGVTRWIWIAALVVLAGWLIGDLL
jgi:hypothetical protein